MEIGATVTSNSFHVEDSIFQNFKASIRGTIIIKGDAGYDEDRKVYNAMIDKHPALIVKCRDVADVIACVNFGRENKILTAIRSGGHNAGGLGLCDDGLVIDLSWMKGIRVDVKANTVRADGGVLLGDLDHATQPFGKAVPSGILSTTGISGLMLGGGLGHLSRAYGLSIDSLIEADVVLANGKLVTASEQENSDLFWAIRGGGGNFGVVTSFLFKLHDAGTVYGGPMLWHIADGEEMMRFYRDYILKAPNNAYCYFAFLTVPPVPIFPEEFHLKKMCGLVWCNVGDADKAKKEVDIFRNYRKPALDYVGAMPYSALQGLFDGLYPSGLQWYWKADFVKDLSDDAIKLNVKYGNKLPTVHSTTHLYPINGVCHNKKNADTAFAYRDANWAHVIVGVDPNPANKETISAWAREYWEALHPFSLGGAYINFMMEEGQERVKASYRDNYYRLAKVKSKYDPDNFFRVNQNIQPLNR
jgi:FAD/FMN-containing dehydrogenase